MTALIGNYNLEKNENIDEYFKALGVPYLVRKMMAMSKPRLEITKDEDEKWTIKTISLMRQSEIVFKLGEEFEETMAAGVVLKNVASLDEDGSITISSEASGVHVTRKYELQDDQVVLTMTHEKSGTSAKRFFKKIP